jgi:hypothetical protein
MVIMITMAAANNCKTDQDKALKRAVMVLNYYSSNNKILVCAKNELNMNF